MAVDPTPQDDLRRLNALIDGELPPAEHAALAARIAGSRELAQAHATLARLKACVAEGLQETPAREDRPALLAKPRRSSGRAAAAVAAAALVAAIVIPLGWQALDDEPAVRPEAAIILAALPAHPTIPDLTIGGLTLVGTEVETVAGISVLVAAYRGPRGCRLEMRVHSATHTIPPTAGTSRRTWTAGELRYELAAFGMPANRFAAVAEVAQAATRNGQPSEPMMMRIREARSAALPCVG
jgi:anti-sigma factor RsiW